MIAQNTLLIYEQLRHLNQQSATFLSFINPRISNCVDLSDHHRDIIFAAGFECQIDQHVT